MLEQATEQWAPDFCLDPSLLKFVHVVTGEPLADNLLNTGGVQAAFSTFAHTGAYPTPGELIQFPLGYSKLKFDNAYAEQASLEIENEIAKDTFVSVGYQFIHALKLSHYPEWFDVSWRRMGMPIFVAITNCRLIRFVRYPAARVQMSTANRVTRVAGGSSANHLQNREVRSWASFWSPISPWRG